jgi:hypothetical protein
VVNDFEPHAVRDEDFRTYFLHPDLLYVLGWTITRESTAERDFDFEENLSAHTMVIRGYRAIDDHGISEKAFQDLVETVRTKLRREQSLQLGGEATFVGPPQCRIFEPRKFGELLVHYAEVVVVCTPNVVVNP